MCPSPHGGDTAAVPDEFLRWGRSVIDAAAALLEAEIPGSRRGRRSSLRDREALYVHFQDAHLPQPLAVWLYATGEGAAYNVRGGKDVIGVGLKHDADDELDRVVWKFRRLGLFTWRTHVDERREGLRWLCDATDLPEDPRGAGAEVAGRVLAALRRAGAIPDSP
jgi:hypothetical protein